MLNSTDKNFVVAASKTFGDALSSTMHAKSDSFSFEFAAPAGRMALVCIVRPVEVANALMDGLADARQLLIEAGETFDPLNDPNFTCAGAAPAEPPKVAAKN